MLKMDLNATSRGGATVVSPVGRIDQASADQFQEALAPHLAKCREGEPALIIDMSGVDYISSVGLRVFMVAAKLVKGQNGRIGVAALTPLVKEVFEISRFNLVLALFDDVDAACVGLGSSG